MALGAFSNRPNGRREARTAMPGEAVGLGLVEFVATVDETEAARLAESIERLALWLPMTVPL